VRAALRFNILAPPISSVDAASRFAMRPALFVSSWNDSGAWRSPRTPRVVLAPTVRGVNSAMTLRARRGLACARGSVVAPRAPGGLSGSSAVRVTAAEFSRWPLLYADDKGCPQARKPARRPRQSGQRVRDWPASSLPPATWRVPSLHEQLRVWRSGLKRAQAGLAPRSPAPVCPATVAFPILRAAEYSVAAFSSSSRTTRPGCDRSSNISSPRDARARPAQSRSSSSHQHDKCPRYLSAVACQPSAPFSALLIAKERETEKPLQRSNRTFMAPMTSTTPR